MMRGSAAALLVSAATAWAQAPAEFYKGRTVELYIGYSVGGGYDIYARLLDRVVIALAGARPATK